jgi:diaminohydroxyphosphoribosylaminopyrimidine deaminase/5-amino-6-(5-phosphoribosylamino)uracil reductase
MEENNSTNYIKTDFNNLIKNILEELYKQNIQSIIIEGGTKTLQSFIDKEMWDEARVFTTNKELKDGVKAPQVNREIVVKTEVGGDKLNIIKND